MKFSDRATSMGAAAILFIGGAYKHPSEYSVVLVTAGLIVLGSWLTMEVIHLVQDRKDKTKE